MADELKFGINLEPNLGEFEASWAKQEKKIQSIIDKTTFRIKVAGTQDLDKLEAQLRRITDLQNRSAKPLTAYRAGQLDIQREVALRNQQATQIQLVNIAREKEAQEIQRTAKMKAQAEAAQARLNAAQERGVATTNAQTRAFQTQSGVLTGLRQFMNSYLSILGAYRLVSNIKDITSEFELQRVSLAALTQDAEFASSLFSKIKATAVESPFSVKQMITYTKQLAAYRFENEELYKTMNMLADVSAGLGVDMSRLILAVGQVKAASVLRGQELRQFTESGIPLVELLAVKFSQLRNEVVSTGEVFELISKRQVPFEMIAEIFKDMTEEGGRFYQMQKKQAQSLYGIFENLKDNIQISMDEVGQANRGLLIGAGKVFTKMAQHLQDIIDLISVVATTFVAYRAAVAIASNAEKGLAISKALVTKANLAMTASEVSGTAARSAAVFVLDEAIATHNVYAACVARAALANNVFARSFWKLAAAVVANPIVATIAGIAAAVAIGTIAYKRHIDKLRSVEGAQMRVADRVSDMEKAQKAELSTLREYTDAIKEQDILIRSQGKSLDEFSKIYPELAKKYKDEISYKNALDNADEKRKIAIDALKSTYGGYFDYLDAETFKIDDLTQGYLKYTEQLREVQKEQLEVQKNALATKIAERETQLGKWAGYSSEDITPLMGGLQNVGYLMTLKSQIAELEGWKAELAEVERQILSLTDAQRIANIVNVNWRQVYKKDVEPTLEDEKLAEVDLQTAIDNTRKKYKTATAAMLSYTTAISTLRKKLFGASDEDAAKIDEDIKNLEASLKEVEKEVAGQKDFASYLGFSLTDDKGGKKNPMLDALKKEYSLVQEIYKRYAQLQKSMSDTSAQKKITAIYGDLVKGGIDFLSPEGLKKKLQELQKNAERLGDQDLSLKIGLAIQDIEFDELKKKLQKKLSEISQEIARSKAGADLFQSFLGLTGDEKLSTSLTIALTGVDITGQNIRQQLAEQLAAIISDESIAPEVQANLNIEPVSPDGGDAEAHIKKISEMIQQGTIDVRKFDNLIASIGDKDLKSRLESALKEYLDYDAKMLQDFFKTINKAGDDKIQRKLLASKRDAASSPANMAMLEAMRPANVTSEEWTGWIDTYLKAVQNEYDEGIAKLDFSAFKEKFAETLANMDAASVSALESVITELQKFLTMPGVDPTMLKSIQELIEKAEKTEIDKTPLKSFVEGWEQVAKAAKKTTKEEKAAERAAGLSKMRKAVNAAKNDWDKVSSAITEVIDLSEEIADALGVEFGKDTQDAIDGFKTGIQVTTTAFAALAAIILVVEAELTPLLVIALAVGAAFAAIKWFSGKKARDAEAAIASYDNHLRELERTLDRLQEAQENFLGKEWIKNQYQQMENLRQQISDINGKIKAEQNQKQKDIDEQAIQDWEDEKLDLERQIRELRADITKEMTGTDLTSSAKEFAEAWLDAYLSFGNTTDAIKGKFKEMMQSMVVNSVLARVVQQKLKPIFDYIDNQLYDKEGNMIGSLETVWAMMKRVTDTLPDELESIYKSMGSWADELRSSESNLTGIAKGVSQASEESVVTLSGYANSILYYQILEATDIAAIRAILEGKTVVTPNAAPAPTSESSSLNIGQLLTIQQDTLEQITLIKGDTGSIRTDIEDIKNTLRSVISGAGSQSAKTVNIRYRQ